MAYLKNITKYGNIENLPKNIIDDVITHIKFFIFNIERKYRYVQRTYYTYTTNDFIQTPEYISFKAFMTIPKIKQVDKLNVNKLKDWVNSQLSYKIYKGSSGYYSFSVNHILYDILTSSDDLNARFSIRLNTLNVVDYECYFNVLNVDVITTILKYSPVVSIFTLTQVYDNAIPDVNFEILYKENFPAMYNNIFEVDVGGVVFKQGLLELLKLDSSIPWKDHYIQMFRTYNLWHNPVFNEYKLPEDIQIWVEDYLRKYTPDVKYDLHRFHFHIENIFGKHKADPIARGIYMNTIIEASMIKLDTELAPQEAYTSTLPGVVNSAIRNQFIRQLKLFDYMIFRIINLDFESRLISTFIYYIWQYSRIYFNYMIDHVNVDDIILKNNYMSDFDLGPPGFVEVTVQDRPMLLDIINRRPEILSPELVKDVLDSSKKSHNYSYNYNKHK